MNRRAFLKTLAAAAAGAVAAEFDPERLLWVPGQKTFFLPPEKRLVTAKTLEEALARSVMVEFPDGQRMSLVYNGTMREKRFFGEGPDRLLGKIRLSPALAFDQELAVIAAEGGRIVSDSEWRPSLDGKQAPRVGIRLSDIQWASGGWRDA